MKCRMRKLCPGRSIQILLLGLILLLALPVPAAAQGIIVDPPIQPPRPPWTSPITVELHSVEAVIDGPVATVQVKQVFRNDSQRQVQGTYVFPLPEEAAISDFQMTVDGQVLEGQILTKEEARRTYEEIVRRTLDPALLEYVGHDLFQASVFPIPAGERRTVALTYRQVLPRQDGLFRFTYPLRTQQGNAKIETLAISVELRNQPGLRTVYSPSHNVSIQRQSDDRALIGFETTDVTPERDFDLLFGTDDSAIGLNLLSYKPAGEEGFFLLLAAPSLESAEREVVARDIVLVLDVSGSMEGEKIEQAKDAARYVVQHLNPGDRFNLISFSTGTDLWRNNPQPLDPASEQAALDWIADLRANGSTDINRALLEALGQIGTASESTAADVAERPAYILFLTDGLPTQGVREPARIIDNALKTAPERRRIRLFTFGVGFDVNTDLLDTVSRQLGGRSQYVLPDEQIDEAVSQFYSGISTPVLADVSIEMNGASVSDTYPFPLMDLFAGEQLIWAGRYQEGGPVEVVLQGTVNGQKQVYRYPERTLAETGGESAVARLWATRKIGALLVEVRRSGSNQEIIDTIVDLSLTYGIVTPYTSYLVLEPDMQARGEPGVVLEAQEMRRAADAAVSMAVEEAAEAPASGEKAVFLSAARQEMEQAETVDEQQGVRYVAGKTFVQQGTMTGPDGASYPFWVDTLYAEGMAQETVIFGSDAYFDLAAQADVARWLSISPELLVVHDGKALHITLEADSQGAPVEPASPVATPAATAPSDGSSGAPEQSGVWETILEFLRHLQER